MLVRAAISPENQFSQSFVRRVLQSVELPSLMCKEMSTVTNRFAPSDTSLSPLPSRARLGVFAEADLAFCHSRQLFLKYQIGSEVPRCLNDNFISVTKMVHFSVVMADHLLDDPALLKMSQANLGADEVLNC